MKLSKEHIGKLVKKETWFNPVRVIRISGDMCEVKTVNGFIYMDYCEDDWQEANPASAWYTMFNLAEGNKHE
jgi:hypothetical protein